MKNKPNINTPLHKIKVKIPILIGLVLAAFSSGKIIDMPTNFPYSRGMWGALGAAVILLCGFIIIFLISMIDKKKR